MRPSDLSSLALAVLIGVAGVAAAVTPVSAGPTLSKHFSDSEFLSAARCAGIAQGLGSDAAAFDKVVQDQDSGREPFISDRAFETRNDAVQQARRAGPDVRAKLTAERDGVCQSYIGG